MSTLLELEVRSVLGKGDSIEVCADQLSKKFVTEQIDFNTMQALCTFYLNSGLYAVLINSMVLCLKRGKKIPWGHLLKAVKMSGATADLSLLNLISGVANQQGLLDELSRCSAFDDELPILAKLRVERRKNALKERIAKREDDLSAIELLESQGMEAEAEKRLARLLEQFPQDPFLKGKYTKYREKRIWGLISKENSGKPSRVPYEIFQKKPEEESQFLENVEQSMWESLDMTIPWDASRHDFAIAHLLWDNPEASLRFLDVTELPLASQWLRFEVLFICRQFIKLLSDLVDFEKNNPNDGEVTFATSYFRAKSLWELGKKKLALEIMEGLVNTRPHYRSAANLLGEWKEEFS